MKSNLTTEAGQTKAPNEAHIDAINQVFALFQLNYHNQYFKAFANNQDLIHIKRLWLEALNEFSAIVIMRAAKEVIKQSEYLPTLKKMLDSCQQVSQPNLPDTRKAFVEACQAPSPKANAKWSHPAVYHAGAASDWYFLQNNPEYTSFPVFKKQYEAVCERIKNGEKLAHPKQIALPDSTLTPLDKEANKQQMASLRKNLDI